MLSRVSFIVCTMLMCYASFFLYPRWNKIQTEATISWDVSGYYWYLPSAFIYHDLKHQSFKDSILHKYQPTNTDYQQGMQVDNGNYVMKYSSGMAIMYLPFFTLAHMFAAPLGYPADGFSAPYQLAIQLGGFLISILGLWYLRRLLLLFYEDKIVAILLVIVVFGTNYLNYSSIDCGMSHAWLFTIYVFILLNTYYLYQSFKTKYAIRLGLLIGLATLTRPTDVISCLIPLLWGLESLSPTAIKAHCKLLLSKYKLLLLALFSALPVIAVQLLYWKYASGHWVVYSYAGQGFYWTHPYTWNYTFSYKSGWLVYTPMMVFAFIGIIPFIRHGRNKVAILSFFFLNYYLVTAWDIWWYGGRAMVQSYPVLLFPIAALVQVALRRRIRAAIFLAVVTVFIYCNLWLTVQLHGGGLYDSESMTKEYFWRVLGRWSAPGETIFLKDHTEVYEPQVTKMDLIYENSFAKDTGDFYHRDPATGTNYLVLDKEHQSSPWHGFAYTNGHAKWLRAQATFIGTRKEWEWYKMSQFIVRLVDTSKTGNDRIVKENFIRPHRVVDDSNIKTLWLDIKLPSEHFDSVNVLFWNAKGDKAIWVKDLKVYQFDQ